MKIKTLAFNYAENELYILDQTRLPFEEKWEQIKSLDEMIHAIKELKVRGAPLIAITAALFIATELKKNKLNLEKLQDALAQLRKSRPTAVNLMHAMDLIEAQAKKHFCCEKLISVCESICNDDIKLCSSISIAGASLIPQGAKIITYCNTGSLATAGAGTALGAIKEAHKQNKNIHVFPCETRPLLQGGRLTTWELLKEEIPHTLICDNMIAHTIKTQKIDLAIVGADRIAANGDTANKIGTLNLALICDFYKIPLIVAAPATTLDIQCLSGAEIPIENRADKEVRGLRHNDSFLSWASPHTQTLNPAFDVTPAQLIKHWVINDRILHIEAVAQGAFKSFSVGTI